MAEPDETTGSEQTSVEWSGTILSAQPRIRLTRSFDQRSHTYQGYVLQLDGVLGAETREFRVAIGAAAHDKQQFRVGDEVGGRGTLVRDARIETADLYKVSRLRTLRRASQPVEAAPPWRGIPPALMVYRERRCRRLDARTYDAKCAACMWGCRMAVELIIDQWKPSVRRYRQETFCYGPLSCAHYRAGPTRKVPGRRGMSYEEEDWVDQEEVSHRGQDE